MKTLGYYNGKIGELDTMQVPMLDRGGYFGDGVYDATMCAGYTINNLEEHLDRFYNSARLLEITVPMEKPALRALLCTLVHKLDDPDQFVYWQVTRGTAMRGHAYPDGPAHLWVMLSPEQPTPMDRVYRLITVPDTRFLHCNIKTINLIPSVMAYQKAAAAGCDEAVFHRDGVVTECAHSNVHILKDGVFRTHPADCHILPGIARAHLIRMCGRLGIPVEETAFTLDDLRAADEVIVSSSGDFCIRACTLDGQPVGGRAQAQLKRLQDAIWDEFLQDTKQNMGSHS